MPYRFGPTSGLSKEGFGVVALIAYPKELASPYSRSFWHHYRVCSDSIHTHVLGAECPNPRFLFDPSLSAPLLRPEPEAPINVEEPGAPDEEEEEQSTTKNSVSI